jgi:hypothetical protein
MLTRRTFVSVAALAGARMLTGAGTDAPAPANAVLHGSTGVIAHMPADFTGLSYEITQLYNPAFFSANNTQLVDAFRQLSANGVLRVGGNLSDVSRWKSDAGDFATPKQTAAIDHGKTYWEWKLTDVWVREHRDAAITPEAIRALRTFLDATNWRLIYGLNFGSGSAERAADEARCVAQEMGDRLMAFQIGNEVDFFGGNRFYREPPFGFAEYAKGYAEFVAAIRGRVPGARFAGPDTASNMGWVDEYAKGPHAEGAVLLSSHYYAMGPAKDPAMNAERLLGPSAGLEKQIAAAGRAVADSDGLGFRMTEGNSCFGGGKPGVSDALASALWAMDYMLYVASKGYVGVNLHGGGDGYYTPIETLDAQVSTPRPEYWGMQLANRFAGYELLQCELETSANVTAFLGRRDKAVQVAMINKGAAAVRVKLADGLPEGKPREALVLSGPSLAATTGVGVRAIEARGESTALAPYSAQLWRWEAKR